MQTKEKIERCARWRKAIDTIELEKQIDFSNPAEVCTYVSGKLYPWFKMPKMSIIGDEDCKHVTGYN